MFRHHNEKHKTSLFKHHDSKRNTQMDRLEAGLCIIMKPKKKMTQNLWWVPECVFRHRTNFFIGEILMLIYISMCIYIGVSVCMYFDQ